MRLLKIIGLSLVLIGCTSAAPVKDFRTTLWKTDAVCIKRVSDTGEVIIICDNDQDWPQDIVGITIEDYNKEVGYQDLLIKHCKKWKR